MNKQQACKLIIMRMAVHYPNQIVDPTEVDQWSDNEIDYILANYEDHYLSEEERKQLS